MKTKAYALFDLKAAAYGTPFFMANDSMAIRSFSELVNDRQTLVNHHPEDFILHGIGQFDDGLGVLEGMTPWVVATAASLIKIDGMNRQQTVDFVKSLDKNGVEVVS